MRSSRFSPIAAVTFACLSSSALADTHSRFDVQQLEVDGAIKEVVAADLDGDGHEDLLVVFDTGVPPDERRNFGIFWNQGRAFSGKPDLIVPAPDDACAFDVADIDDQPGDELLLITPTGVTSQSLRGRQWGARAPLVTEPTLFHQAGAGELPRMKIVEDLAGPGSHDLIVPGLGVAALYHRKGTQFELAGRIELTMDGSLTTRGLGRDPGGMPPVSLKYRYPAILVADTDGDGRGDLVASLDDRLAVYRQLDNVTFAPKPTFQRNFAIRTLDELKEASSSAAISVSDIDGDGVADLVVRKEVEHGLASAITTTYVFFGQKGGVYAEKADQIIKSQGASGTAVELIDLTADGHPDLVVPSVNIGVLAIIRILTTKSLFVTYQVFPFEPAGRRFADKPTSQRDLKFSISLSGEADVQAVEERGDYNGDRRPDLAFATDENELSIFPGIAGKQPFASDAIEKIPVRAYGDALPVDLDHQGKSDLVLHFPNTKGHRGDVVVLRNRGPW